MKNNSTTLLSLFLALFSLPLITGCGSNIFGEDDPTEDPLKSGDYAEVIAEADAIISDSSQLTENQEAAKVRKSEAHLGEIGFSIIDLMTDLTDLEDSEDEDIFGVVELGEEATVESLGEVLDTMNDVSTNYLSEDDAESFSLKREL